MIAAVSAHIADKQVNQPVVIEIEKHWSGGIGNKIYPGALADVCEMAVSIVFEQNISASDCRDEEVFCSVVIDVGKRRAYTDAAGQRDSGLFSDVFEFSAAETFQSSFSPA